MDRLDVAALAVGVFVWGLIFWCVVRYRKRGDELPRRPGSTCRSRSSTRSRRSWSSRCSSTTRRRADRRRQAPEEPGRRPSRSSAFKWNWQFNYRDGPAARTAEHGRVDARLQRLHPGAGAADRQDDPVRGDSQRRHPLVLGAGAAVQAGRLPGQRAQRSSRSTIDQEGRYVGRCAELCGTYHSMMNFELRAVSPEKYEQFLAAKKAGRVDAGGAGRRSARSRYATTTEPFPTTARSRDTADELRSQR